MNNELKKIADDCAKIQKNIKELSEKLDVKKKSLSVLMEKSNHITIKGIGYYINFTKMKVQYTTTLSKEFKNLKKETISKLLQEDLITEYYKLNTRKYQKLKKDNVKSEIDAFVRKRSKNSVLSIFLHE